MPGENFPGDRIVSLVDELEGLIEEAAAFRQERSVQGHRRRRVLQHPRRDPHELSRGVAEVPPYP